MKTAAIVFFAFLSIGSLGVSLFLLLDVIPRYEKRLALQSDQIRSITNVNYANRVELTRINYDLKFLGDPLGNVMRHLATHDVTVKSLTSHALSITNEHDKEMLATRTYTDDGLQDFGVFTSYYDQQHRPRLVLNVGTNGESWVAHYDQRERASLMSGALPSSMSYIFSWDQFNGFTEAVFQRLRPPTQPRKPHHEAVFIPIN